MDIIVNASKPKYNSVINAPMMVSISGEVKIPYNGGRTGVYLIIFSVEGAVVNVKAGDGIFAGGDLMVSLGAGESKHVLLEPGLFVQTEGPDKGHIVLSGGQYSVSAIELD